MSDKYPASIWRAENPARESHLDPPALYRDQAPLPGTRGWVEYHHTGDCSKAWDSLQALRARDAAELEEAQQIIQQRTEIAVNYQKELKAEREARKGDSAELEKLRMQLALCGMAAMLNTEESKKDRISRDNPYWSASYGDVCRAVDREIAERSRNARLTAALEKIAKGSDDFHERSKYTDMACEALREAGKS